MCPEKYVWEGVECSYGDSAPPKIISLNLTSIGLKGNIADSFSNLTSLVTLDLSNNQLTGEIPDFFADLPFLKTLNLSGNRLSGSVPQRLQHKADKGSLSLRVHGNPDLCQSESCSKKKKTAVAVIVASVILSVILLVAAIASWFFFLRTRQRNRKHSGEGGLKSAEAKRRDSQETNSTKTKGGISKFTYEEVIQITEGLQKQIGQGGFGNVYEGHLKNGTRVAVKMLSSSIHASEQFNTEVELLISIRHKNLVSFMGYSEDQETNLALIYEYMANGDLRENLSGRTTADALSWKRRLHIAIDAAQGLDYLHSGCNPHIVHRDVKSANILLDENFRAKLADFGLSKIFPTDDRPYVSTRVIGTLGYLDPEYSLTGQLTEKSDIYSFGVVLLELITSQEAIIKTNNVHTTLVQWVQSKLEKGDTSIIVDPRINGSLKPNNLWRVTKTAMACVRPVGAERPNMRQVVTVLHECLDIEDQTQEEMKFR